MLKSASDGSIIINLEMVPGFSTAPSIGSFAKVLLWLISVDILSSMVVR